MRNLITIAKEQCDLTPGMIDADEVTILQSIKEMKSILDDWEWGAKEAEMDRARLKERSEAYDKGYKAGANHKNNKPCVCGFWGENTLVQKWHDDCQDGK